MYKIFIVSLFFITILYGFDDFDCTLNVSKNQVVVKEAVILSINIKQKSINDVMSFDFSLPKSDTYTLELIKSDEKKDNKGRSRITAQYVLYPLKTGTWTIVPKLLIKRASKDELQKFVTGSADELMYLQTRNKQINLKSFELKVRALDKNVTLVGDYRISYTLNRKSVSDKNQINVTYTVSGYGYKPDISRLFTLTPDIDLFIDKEVYDKNTFHKLTFKYAIKASRKFTIPKISLSGYNPELNKFYKLETPSLDIAVNHKDKTSSKSINHESFLWKKYLNYFLLFLTGFLTEKIFKILPKKGNNNEDVFINKVKSAKNPKSLLNLLLAYAKSDYKKQISELEMIIYNNKGIKFIEIKEDVLKHYHMQKNDDSVL